MKKFFLSIALFAVSGAYVMYQYLGGASNTQAVATAPSSTTQDNSSSPSAPVSNSVAQTKPSSSVSNSSASTPVATKPTPSTPVSTPAPTPTPAPKPKGQYVDGTYTGSVADAYYGNVQVEAVIQGGKLADVTFLQYPNDRRTSQYINSQAMPQLRQEAIAAQSANVSGVSGASDTSAAFVESLSNALSQAKS